MTSDERVYWIWLQNALGPRANSKRVFGFFERAKDIYDAGSMEWRLSGVFTPKQIGRLESSSFEEAQNILDTCDKNAWAVVTPESELFPPLLKDLHDFPLVLYVRGDLSCLSGKVSIAIVGTRQASAYGTEVAFRLSKSFAEAGAVVVSGGALGVDSAAHDGALQGKGKTVAVLGCGLASNYLSTNSGLRGRIAQSGAVVSEYPPDTPASGPNFPIRNRLISGMSLGTLVIEAGERSGSLITANFALDQGRGVFAVAGDIINSSFTGAHKLIRDGAKPVFSAMDVLEEYKDIYPGALDLSALCPLSAAKTTKAKVNSDKSEGATLPKATLRRKLPEGLGDLERRVYEAVDTDPTHIDDIFRACKDSPPLIITALTQLELFGYIRLTDGKRYVLI